MKNGCCAVAGVDLIFMGFLNEATHVSSLNVNKPVSGSLPLPLSNHTTPLSHSYSLALCLLLRCVYQCNLHTHSFGYQYYYCMTHQILHLVEEKCAVIFLINETYSFLVDDKRGKHMDSCDDKAEFSTKVFIVT